MTPKINNNNNNNNNNNKWRITSKRFVAYLGATKINSTTQNKRKYTNKHTATGNKMNTRMQREMSVTTIMVTKMQFVNLIWRIVGGLDGPGSNAGGDEIFRPSRPALGPQGSFPGIKCGRSVLLTTHSLLVPRSWKSRAIPLPTLRATQGL